MEVLCTRCTRLDRSTTPYILCGKPAIRWFVQQNVRHFTVHSRCFDCNSPPKAWKVREVSRDELDVLLVSEA